MLLSFSQFFMASPQNSYSMHLSQQNPPHAHLSLVENSVETLPKFVHFRISRFGLVMVS